MPDSTRQATASAHQYTLAVTRWKLCSRHWGLAPWFPRLCSTVAHNRGNHPDKRGGGETIGNRRSYRSRGIVSSVQLSEVSVPSIAARPGFCLAGAAGADFDFGDGVVGLAFSRAGAG